MPAPIQQPNPAANTQFPGTNSVGSASNELNGSSFMTLLVAQLQAQDPLNPMDPSTMVTQLTQVNSLQELYQIDADMQTLISSVNGTSTTPAQSSAQVSQQNASQAQNSQANSSSSNPLAKN